MKKQLFALTIALISYVVPTFAQNGTLTGTVNETGQTGMIGPIPLASIFVIESVSGGTTDFDGKYTISLPAGTYTVVTSYIGLYSDTATVSLAAGETKTHNVDLAQNAQMLSTFEVKGKSVRESETILLMQQQEAKSLEQKIGSRELVKTGSSNVSAGLAKVSGVSVVGSKHIFVRGMGDRYNSAYLNGMPLASTDPDKRVIPLNIFPTAIVSNLTVRKAFTADLYGDFAGGAIDIRTKAYPEDKTLKVSFGAGLNTTSAFQDFRTYKGGSNDYFGMDDGTRDLPSNVENNPEYSSGNNESGTGYSFDKNMNPETINGPLNTSFSITGGNFISTDSLLEGSGIGYLVLMSHNNSSQRQQGAYRIANRQDEVRLDYDIDNYVRNTTSSALANVIFQIQENQTISYNFLYANQSSDQTRETDGSHFDYGRRLFTRRFTYREMNLQAHQVSGYHGFLINDMVNFKWSYMTNKANSKEPDRRQLVWLYNPGDSFDDYLLNSIDVNDNHRFFSDLDETENSIMAEINIKLKWDHDKLEKTLLGINLGINRKAKERLFDFRQFNYRIDDFNTYYPNGLSALTPDDFINDENHDAGAFEVQELFNAASENTSTLDIDAYYAQIEAWVLPQWQVVAGARYESGLQTISFRDQVTPIILNRNRLDEAYILPSLVSKYKLSEKDQLRAAISKTISRPGFKEVAPFQYIEFFAGRQTVGNPELTNGTNYNTDLRYERYPNSGELIAVTGFYKSLIDPIEQTMLGTASGQLASYVNSESATVAGVEFELRKKLTSFASISDSSFLGAWSVGFNAAYLYSQVNIGDSVIVNGASAIQTNNKRPLQGASPYLANIDLTYEKRFSERFKSTATVSYNVFGRRLSAVGIQGIGDIYELPVNTVNFIVQNSIGDHWGVRFSAKNLLNPTIKQEQEANEGDDIEVNSFQRGVTLGLTISYNVF